MFLFILMLLVIILMFIGSFIIGFKVIGYGIKILLAIMLIMLVLIVGPWLIIWSLDKILLLLTIAIIMKILFFRKK